MEDQDCFEKEALHFAVMSGDLARVSALLASGRDLNAFDEVGKTPLHHAAAGAHLEIMRLLLASGADPNAHDVSQAGNTPLADVAGNCSFEVPRLLVEAGADPTIPGWMQLTALDRAAKAKAWRRPCRPPAAARCRQASGCAPLSVLRPMGAFACRG